MSERRDGDGSSMPGCVGWLIVIIVLGALEIWALNGIEKRDNWILDLQRRVGQLESER